MRAAGAALAAGFLLLLPKPTSSDDVRIGERGAIETHLLQSDIDSGQLRLADLLSHGQRLFDARFNRLDGQGRPGMTGHGVPRGPHQPAFVRISGPDANSCMGCHFQPRSGGAGDFAANVFVLAQERDPVVMTLDVRDSNERNTLGMMGAGAIELVAREMTAELIAAREAALTEAKATKEPVRRRLSAKGVSFGAVLVYPDGVVDPRGIEGVDWDLVIKPFHQKGAVVSLREFSNTAMNHHHGIQAAERFGTGVDADKDGVVDELTPGDVTAITLFQASLNVPGRVRPAHPRRREAAARGEGLFAEVGCTACHVPELVLNDPVFTEPNPYNPPGNLRPADVRRPVRLDLTRDAQAPRLERDSAGRVVVRAFTDLKRHDLNDADYNHFANERAAQGTTGSVEPRFSETYTLHTTSDDGVRLWIDGQLVIDNWTQHTAAENTASLTLEAGRKYSIRLEHFDDHGPALIRLEWSSPREPRQVIPQTQLYPPAQ